jgi:hypothetical protein
MGKSKCGKLMVFFFSFSVIVFGLVAASLYLSESLCHAQDPYAYWSNELRQRQAEQQNLINNINFLGNLREKARARAQLARTAGERQTYTESVNQYNALTQRINEFQQRLNASYQQSNEVKNYLVQIEQQRRGGYSGGTIVPPNLNQPGGPTGGAAGGGYGAGGGRAGGGQGAYNPPGGGGAVDLLGNTAR